MRVPALVAGGQRRLFLRAGARTKRMCWSLGCPAGPRTRVHVLVLTLFSTSSGCERRRGIPGRPVRRCGWCSSGALRAGAPHESARVGLPGRSGPGPRTRVHVLVLKLFSTSSLCTSVGRSGPGSVRKCTRRSPGRSGPGSRTRVHVLVLKLFSTSSGCVRRWGAPGRARTKVHASVSRGAPSGSRTRVHVLVLKLFSTSSGCVRRWGAPGRARTKVHASVSRGPPAGVPHESARAGP